MWNVALLQQMVVSPLAEQRRGGGAGGSSGAEQLRVLDGRAVPHRVRRRVSWQRALVYGAILLKPLDLFLL